MPTYVYQCQDCGNQFESLRPMRDSDAPISCQSCSSSNTRRRLTTFNMSSASSSESPYASPGSCGCGNCQGGSCASCGH